MSPALDAAIAVDPDAWVIEPQRTGLSARAVEFWRYRRVLWFLASRTVKARYERMTLGVFWLFARPLIPILITGFVFGKLLGIPSDGVPFIMFFMTGVVPWNLFDRSILFGTKALEQHRNLIKKLYFPRLIAPIASMAPAIVDFVVYVALLILVTLFYLWHDGKLYVRLGPTLLLGFLMAVVAVCAALGVVLWSCVLQARHRDVRYTLRYVMQFWMYLTPVFYPLSLIPPERRWLLYINPMGSIVATFRWAVIGVGEMPIVPLISSIAVVTLAIVVGIWFFTANESATVDQL